ncbi:MAG: peptidoglycan DD-metalloendopeptidase family protein [Pseudomonadota bacterium]
MMVVVTPTAQEGPAVNKSLVKKTRSHILAICLLAIISAPAVSQVASERELEDVRRQIAALTDDINERTRERDALTADLGVVERKMANARTRLGEIDNEIAAAEARLVEIAAQTVVQQNALAEQQAILAKQLRTAYMSGRQERIKLLLNQQSPATLGRMLQYYRYLSKARVGNIDAVQAAISSLASLKDQAAKTRDDMVILRRETTEVLAALDKDRTDRSALVDTINQRLNDERQMLASLNEREQEVQRLLESLSEILEAYPTGSEAPMSTLRGDLTWPVAGSVRINFGSNMAGGRVKSRGMVLATDSGTEVRAIYHGQVLYADWLPGMGLLVIVDHGEALMSLYGYNETLQVSVGDWIAPGDVIATVGNSGGQGAPGLYFELRAAAKPVNPRPWFKRRPGPNRR